MKRTLVTIATLAVIAVPLSFGVQAQDAKKESSKSARKSGSLDKKDAQYLRRMGEADLAEVEAGKLAQQKASSAEVKKFSQHMVDEHGKGMKEGESLARSKGQEMPKSPAKKHQAAMKKLQGLSGDEFDRAYMKQMVQDHQEALKLVKDAAQNAKDAEIRAAAEKKAPIIQEHLDMAKQQVSASK